MALLAAYLVVSMGLWKYVWLPPCSSHVLWFQTDDCDPSNHYTSTHP